jgi:formylmethanofuran--tetrahydromethanopterin N-formyltransferase
LAAARRAVESLREKSGVITPFPGGVVRSGSKVGSRYSSLPASTNDAFCPSIRGNVKSLLPAGANCAYEIVIDAVDEPTMRAAMASATRAAAGAGIVAISAANYGGTLGKYRLPLREVLQ